MSKDLSPKRQFAYQSDRRHFGVIGTISGSHPCDERSTELGAERGRAAFEVREKKNPTRGRGSQILERGFGR
jgi:hypothetical protein